MLLRCIICNKEFEHNNQRKGTRPKTCSEECRKEQHNKWCREYNKEHPEQRYTTRQKNYKRYKEIYRLNHKNTNQEARTNFLRMYGNKCECCGEEEEVFLTIDHKKGQLRGYKNKERSYVAYTKAIKEHNPEMYRILCMNCNHAVRFGRTCPHQIQSNLERENQ